MSERFLANENFPLGMAQTLRSQGNDVVHASDTFVGETDPVILQTALAQDRVLLTFDHDFGELVFRHEQPPAPGIVLFRLQQLAPDALLAELETFFAANPILRGYFTVVSPGQYRQTALPSGTPPP
jgi:predicted nuclease of predicted toxin-antitoxin system